MLETPERDEQAARAGLLDGADGVTPRLGGPPGQLGLRKARPEPLAADLVLDGLLGGRARAGVGEESKRSLRLEARQGERQAALAGNGQGDAGVGPVVEQPVAQREVEETALPSVEAHLLQCPKPAGDRDEVGRELDLPWAFSSQAGGRPPRRGRRGFRRLQHLGQRMVARSPRRVQVDDVHASRHVPKPLLGPRQGGSEVGAGRAGKRGLDEADLSQLHAVEQRRRALVDGLGERIAHRGEADDRVPVARDDHHDEPGGLEQRRQGDRQVEAVAEPIGHDLGQRADLLALVLEAGLHGLVRDPPRRERAVAGLGDALHPLRASRLVAIERRRPGPSAQRLRRHAQEVMGHR